MDENRKNSVRTVTFMIGLVLFVVLFSAASGIAVKYGIKLAQREEAQMSSKNESSGYVVVIDPGHGGEDGGCSAGDALEKDLNLDVAKRVSCICSLFGIETKMTRTDDRLVYDMYSDLADYTGKKKLYDLKNRVRFTKEADAFAYVGIHMNKFPDSSCRGMQIYYAEKADGSLGLAEKIKSRCSEATGGEVREIKKGKSAIFVLSHAECPSVLVECGFLSSPSDLEKLTNESGKTEAATVIALGIFDSLKGLDS